MRLHLTILGWDIGVGIGLSVLAKGLIWIPRVHLEERL